MKSVVSPLEAPASIPVLRRLLAAGALDEREELSLEAQVRGELPARLWLDCGLLSLGVVLILAGIGYFFAHNWQHLTDADKLGLAAGAVLASLVGATWAGFDRFVGKLLLLGASALVGVFIAVFGQVFQTGADTYELFTSWAVLIIPWVVLGRFMPLWIFWLALLNFALGFYWPVSSRLIVFDDIDVFRHVAITLALLNGAALLLREIAGHWPRDWFDRGGSMSFLLLATLVPATAETVSEILQSCGYEATSELAWLAGSLDAALIACLGYYYSQRRYSLANLALVTLSACVTLTFVMIRVLDFDHHLNSGTWLLAGILVLAIFGAGVFFLRTQRLAHQNHA